MQGQVTIYTIKGCPFCLRAKQTLKEHGLPIVELSVDEQSEDLRLWLKETTGKSSVPQVFFNEVLIGGNDDLQALIKDEVKWGDMLNKLDEPFIPSILQIPRVLASKAEKIEFHCTPDPKAGVMEDLCESGIVQNIRPNWFSSKYTDAFSGHSFIEWYCKAKDVSAEEAIEVGTELISKKFILLLNSEIQEPFQNDPKVFYKLNKSSEDLALNAGSTQLCEIDDANKLSEILRKLVLDLYDNYISSDGKFVDYNEMKISSSFDEYVKLARELQRVAVESLSEDERKAFFINIYNALVIHGTALTGAPTGWISRLRFYDATKYIIGGHSYSLNDIENGVLRGNKKGILTLFPPFGKNDARKSTSLTLVDPRIHFALNCGAKSCPPIKTFKAETIDQDLLSATEAYLETDEGIKITIGEPNKPTRVWISSLFKWYKSDFGDSNLNVLKWISNHVGNESRKNFLLKVIQEDSFKISYLPYDWGSNAKE